MSTHQTHTPRDPAGPIRVLHVDREPDFVESTATRLERSSERIHVETATDACDGLDRLADGDFDCVVSGYELPDCDGIAFLERVREDDPELPFILYTGDGSEAIASDAISLGVTDYLQKSPGGGRDRLLARRIENAVAQRRAGRRATEAEAVLRELTETSNDILWVFSADWTELLFINSPYEDIWGRSIEALAERPTDFLDGVHPDDREAVTTAMEALSEGGSVDIEFRVNADEGYRRWVWVQGEPVHEPGDEPDRVAGFVRDVTDRKERERELRRFQRATEAAGDAVFLTDADGVIEYTNPAFEEITGYGPEEAVGETPSILDSGEMPAGHFERLWETILAGDVWDEEIVNERKDGSLYHAHQTIAPIADDDGERAGYVAVQTDITERKERERALERQNEQLDKFASVVSHDLRNPLNVAEGWLELARADCESEYHRRIEGAHDRMERLIDDVLTLAREGQRVREREPVSLSTTAADAWETVDTGAATLAVEADGTVEADPTRLRRLFENLIRNAVEHAGADVTVEVGDLDGGDGFYVADDGPGIPASDRERVFDSGFSTDDDGTGFGLAIVRGIAHAHEWDVGVTETEDGGPRFEFVVR